MSGSLFKNARNVVLAIAIAAWAAGPLYAQHNHSMHMGHQAPDQSAQQHEPRQPSPAKPPVATPPGPHGGRMTAVAPLTFEVVYQPKEVRVYIYGPAQKPQSVEKVKGEIALRRRNDDKVTRTALEYTAPPAGSSEQDYLAAKADLGNVKEGEMTATLKLENLPLRKTPATFGQPVAISKAKPQVKLATIEPSDRANVARQRVCPVTGAALGSMGDPIKVLVGDQPLYLCCKGCLGKVQSAPETYLRKVSQSSQPQ